MKANKLSTLTHAVVRSLKIYEFLLVEICNIHEFEKFGPMHKKRFDPNKTYSMKDSADGSSTDIHILFLGGTYI